MRAQAQDFLDDQGGDVFQAFGATPQRIEQRVDRNSKEGLILAQFMRQGQHRRTAVEPENRGLRAFGLNGHQRGRIDRFAAGDDHRHVGQPRRAKQRRHRHAVAEFQFGQPQQPRDQQRMPAQFEKVVVAVDGFDLQHFTPASGVKCCKSKPSTATTTFSNWAGIRC